MFVGEIKITVQVMEQNVRHVVISHLDKTGHARVDFSARPRNNTPFRQDLIHISYESSKQHRLKTDKY